MDGHDKLARAAGWKRDRDWWWWRPLRNGEVYSVDVFFSVELNCHGFQDNGRVYARRADLALNFDAYCDQPANHGHNERSAA